MSATRPPSPHGVPTLTEVVPWPEADRAGDKANVAPVGSTGVRTASGAAPAAVPEASPAVPEAAAASISEEQVAQRVLVDLQHHIDLMLDVRLKESMAPILARATDALVRDVRNQLTSTLRDVVTRAVAQELARQKPR
jgi:hypothetical protein